MFMPHFQLQLKSSLKLTLADIDLTINENQIHMFALLIKSPVSHTAGNAVFQSGMFSGVWQKKIRFLLISSIELKFHLLKVGEDNPEDKRRNLILSLGSS